MANPITWQNIQTPSQGNPAQFMQLATNGIDGAFDKLQGVLKQRETTDQANWEAQKGNNTQAFLDQMAQFRTPQELQAAQASGQLEQLRQGYGAQVDRSAIRSAEQNQLGVLQKRTTDGIAHDTAVAANKNAPILEEYLTASPARQAEIVAQNPGMAGLGAAVQATQKFGWDRDKAKQAADLAPITRNQLTAQINESNARTANIPVEQARLAQTANLAVLDRLGVMRERARDDLGKTSKSWVGSADGQKHLADGIIKGTQDKVTAQAVSQQINSLVGNNPKYAELPAATVLQIALGNMKGIGTGEWWDSNNTSDMKKALDSALDSNKTSLDEVKAKRADITAQIEQIKGQIDSAERKAFPEFAKQIDAAKAKQGGGKVTEVVNPFDSPEATDLAAQTKGTKLEVSKDSLPTAKPLIEQQVVLEKAKMNLGVIRKYSPEVQKYLDSHKAEEKKADAAKVLKAALYNNGYSAAPMGMQYTNADIQGPLDALKQQQDAFDLAVEAAKKAR